MSYPLHQKAGGAASRITRTQKNLWGLETGTAGIGSSLLKAADTLNLIWEGDSLKRRPGCHHRLDAPEKIYGIYSYGEYYIIHSGSLLLRYPKENPDTAEPVCLFDQMNEAPSRGVNRYQQVEERSCDPINLNGWRRRSFFGELLFINDGKNFLFYDGNQVHSCIDDCWGEAVGLYGDALYYYGTAPDTTVAKQPDSAAGDVDPRGDNRLTQFRSESFYLGDEPSSSYLLNCSLEAYHQDFPLELRLRDETGVWRNVACLDGMILDDLSGMVRLTVGDFYGGMALTLDEEGRVSDTGSGDHYIAADGMDNLILTYAVIKDPPAELSGATVQGLYGPEGSNDVLFLGGSSAAPGLDYFSASNNFLCFYETSYEQLGNRDTPITGYCRLSDGRLAVLKNDPGESTVYFRSHQTVEAGTAADGSSYFLDAYPSCAGAAVAGCVNPATVGWAGNEPCFLADSGLYSVRSVSDELINLNETIKRSQSINLLLQEEDPSSACCACWQGLYLLFFGQTVFVTDGRMDGEGNYRFLKWLLPREITATAVIGDGLYLGDAYGNVQQMTEEESVEDQEMDAFWETASIEETDGVRLILKRMELLITPGEEPVMPFLILKNGAEGPLRTAYPEPGARPCWVPVATRFGKANDLAVRIYFPSGDGFHLWGLRTVYHKSDRR